MFEVLDEVCQPTRATKYSAMVDLYAREDVVIGAGETKIVNLGVKIDLLELEYISSNYLNESKGLAYEIFCKEHYLELHPRSSLRAKGLIIGVGIIDLDYPDEIGLIVHNPIRACGEWGHYEHNYTINKGDKVAQCTLVEHKGYLMGIESETERVGGFGHSGS